MQGHEKNPNSQLLSLLIEYNHQTTVLIDQNVIVLCLFNSIH